MLLLALLVTPAFAGDFVLTPRLVFHADASIGAGGFVQGLAGVEDGRFGARPTWASPYFVGDYTLTHGHLRLVGGGWLAPVVVGEDDVSIPIPGGFDAAIGYGNDDVEIYAIGTLPIPAVGLRTVVRHARSSQPWGVETRVMWAPELWGAVASLGICWTPQPFEWTLDSDPADPADAAPPPSDQPGS